MKKNLLIPLLIFTGSVSSCNKGENINNSINYDEGFYIEAETTNYIIGESKAIELKVSRINDLANYNITFFVLDGNENNVKFTKSNNKYFISIMEKGKYIIKAKISDNNEFFESKNYIEINASNGIEIIKNKINNVFDDVNGIILGYEYDIGISKFDSQKYRIEGADGILKINGDGLLEIIGFGFGTCKIMFNSETIYSGYYNVNISILCTKIRYNLLELNVINSNKDNVTNEMLKEVSDLDLDGELINNPSCSYGIRYLTNLKTLNLSNNGITDLNFLNNFSSLLELNLSNNEITSIDPIVDNQNLKKLDLKNNKISNITKLQYLHQIEYLDLSNNKIENISPLSSSLSLKSLFLNGNTLTSFYDSLSGLSSLEELAIGYCGINFSNIKSLPYLNQLTYLDISQSSPSLNDICKLSKLKNLYLSDCMLSRENITVLNELINLETLDISNNNFSVENYNNSLDGNKLNKIISLKLGGNNFSQIPNLSNFKNLKELDLTNSFNLTSLSSIQNTNISTLILDNCNFLQNDNIVQEIKAFPNLKKLSIKDAFNYLTKSTFDKLCELVENDSIELRFLKDRFLDKNTISNYTKSIYFSLEELLNVCSKNDEAYTIPINTSQIILSLVNDTSNITKSKICFNISKSIMEFDIYGRKYESDVYEMSFNILDRNESSLIMHFDNFKTKSAKKSIISASDGSKLIIKNSGETKFLYNEDKNSYNNPLNGSNTIDAYDVTIENYDTKGTNSLYIIGENGQNGAKGANGNGNDYGQKGETGGNGGAAIKCHSLNFFTSDINLVGGNGGNGGKSGESKCGGWKANEKGVTGGNGGNGGYGVIYSGELTIYKNCSPKITGGIGGNGGQGGAWNNEIALGCSAGDNGKNGYNGDPYMKEIK